MTKTTADIIYSKMQSFIIYYSRRIYSTSTLCVQEMKSGGNAMNSKMKSFLIVLLLSFIPLISNGMVMTGSGSNLSMIKQNVKVVIDNQVAQTRLEQTFINPTPSPIEAVYRFPLGEKASIQEFGITGPDGVRKIGSVETKDEAENIYQNAQAMGAIPAVAQSVDPNCFETKVGAVPSNGRAVIDLNYNEVLPYHSGIIHYSIPLNINAVQNKSLDIISITIDIKEQKEIVAVTSPSHKIEAKKIDAHNWQVVYEKSGCLPDSDFQLCYEVKAQRMGMNFLSTQPVDDKKGYFMMMLAPQEIVDAADIAARDIIFVMDVSGSMNGYKIEQTKAAFNFFIDQLNSEDRFEVIGFSDTLQFGRGQLQTADTENRKQAKNFIDHLRPGGSTNIHDALNAALKLFPNENRTKAIIFLTDGQPTSGITNIQQICRTMRIANTKSVRTFVFGVGDDVSAQLLDKLALENRGEALYVHQNENLQSKLTAFYETISKPLLTDIEIDWGKIQVSECFPPTLPNVYKGSQVVVSGRYAGGGSTAINVKGNLNGQIQNFTLEAHFAKRSIDNKFVARLWGKAKAESLIQEIRANGETADKKSEVIRLSKAFQFTTPYTSFISVTQAPLVSNTNPDQYRNNQSRNYQPQSQSQMAPVTAVAPGAASIIPQQTVTVVKKTEAKQVRFWGAAGFGGLALHPATWFPAAIAIPNFRKAREQGREKACYANMRVILGAVEMYNMDHSSMMRTANIDDLRSGQYLKAAITPPENGCAYGTIGDLASDGHVICLLHGAVESDDCNGYSPSGSTNYGGYSSSSQSGTTQGTNFIVIEEPVSWTVKLWNTYFPMIELAINIPILLLGLYVSYLFLNFTFWRPLVYLLGGSSKRS